MSEDAVWCNLGKKRKQKKNAENQPGLGSTTKPKSTRG